MPATKLTDTQLVILSAASRREDRGVVLPTNVKGGAAQKLVAKLIDLGLIEEVRARGELPDRRRYSCSRARRPGPLQAGPDHRTAAAPRRSHEAHQVRRHRPQWKQYPR